MLERYEKKIILEYLCRALKQRVFFNRSAEGIISWLRDYIEVLVPVGRRSVKLFERLADAVDMDDISYSAQEKLITAARLGVLGFIDGQARKLERARPTSTARSIDLIGKSLDLSPAEQHLFAFICFYQTNKVVEEFFDIFKNHHSAVESIMAAFLDLSAEEVGSYLNGRGRLFSSGLLKGKSRIVFSSLKYEVNDFVLAAIIQGAKTQAEIREVILGAPCCSDLGWDDYEHLGEQRTKLVAFLEKAIQEQLTGVNILLYGPPGTGKTEFSKVLSKKLGVDLFSVGETSDEGTELDRKERVACHSLACSFLQGHKDSLLLFDEMEDLYESSSLLSILYGGKGCGSSKVFINRMLENNPVPTIWTINDPKILDESVVRRMAFAIEMKTPPLHARSRLWKRMLKKHQVELPDAEVTKLARQEAVSPAIAENAIRFAKMTDGSMENISFVTNGLVKAMHGGEQKNQQDELAPPYDQRLANPDINLDRLLKGLSGSQVQRGFSLCLYGPPGTGKSAFGVHLAEQLGMEVLMRRASDLLNSYVGQTEKNIARAFEQAREEEKILILDEADSFLQDRRNAQRSWEVTQVNEMLTWMEKHPLPFVCTTNLMDSLDQASLRRFTFKVCFNYMSHDQQTAAFEFFFNQKVPQGLHLLRELTPGDFSVVQKKARILGQIEDVDLLVDYLRDEVGARQSTQNPIGFCA